MASKLEVILSVADQGFEHFKQAVGEIDKVTARTFAMNQAFEAARNITGTIKGLWEKAYAPASAIAEAVEKQSQSLNMSTTEMQKWNFVASQNKASTESVTNAFTKLLNTQYEAVTGNKAAAEAFKDLGVSVTNARGELKNSDQIINDTMRALSGITNESRRAALAQDVFGRGGKELLPLLAQGTDAIEAQKRAAEELGQVMSEEAVKALTATNDALDRMKTSLAVAGGELTTAFLPALQKAADIATRLASEAAIGWKWMLGGEKAAAEAQAASEARTRELQDMIALKAEYESIIGAQEAFMAHKSALFDEETLISYKAALDNLKTDIKNFNMPTSSGSSGGFTPTGGGDEKADKKAMDRLQSAAKKDRDFQFADAKARFENDQRIAKERMEAQEKVTRDLINNEKDKNDAIIKSNADMYRSLHTGMAKLHADEKKMSEEKKLMYIANAREQLSVLTNVLQEAASRSKAAAVAYKSLAIATTIIDTYSGAQKAFNSLASIPYVGYALGLVAAGATVAAGLMRVNEIRKQQFASGGVSQGGVARVGEMGPENVLLPAGSQVINHHNTQQMINNQNRGHTLNVTVMNERGSVSDRFVRELRDGTADYAVKQLLKKTRSLGLASA